MIKQSQFIPARGIAGAHLQTLLPKFIRYKLKIEYIHQTVELNDGDFIDLAWGSKAENGKPIVIIFHGLEGSINSAYAKGLMQAIENRGWTSLLMHFRGCSGRLNRLARSYHSGETGDAKLLFSCLKDDYPDSILSAVGFSLGANMLLKSQAEYSNNSPLSAIVSICAPLLLNSCALRLQKGLSKIYQRYLLKDLIVKTRIKSKLHNYKKIMNLDDGKINRLNTFRKFDDFVTAPLHGFKNVDDYYSKSSCKQYLKDIQIPTLIIQALDDPFMSCDVIPKESELNQLTTLELSQQGGHVGFIGGSILKPEFWLEKRVIEYLNDYII